MLKAKVKTLSGQVKKLEGDNNALLKKIGILNTQVSYLIDFVGFTATDVDDQENGFL